VAGVSGCPRGIATNWLTGSPMRRWGIYGERRRLQGWRGGFGLRSGRVCRSAHLIAARTLSSLSRWRAERLPRRFSPLCAGYDQRGDCIKESSSLVRLAQMGPPAFGIGGRYNACLLHAAHVTTQEKL